jgi:hypothetical protein
MLRVNLLNAVARYAGFYIWCELTRRAVAMPEQQRHWRYVARRGRLTMQCALQISAFRRAAETKLEKFVGVNSLFTRESQGR